MSHPHAVPCSNLANINLNRLFKNRQFYELLINHFKKKKLLAFVKK